MIRCFPRLIPAFCFLLFFNPSFAQTSWSQQLDELQLWDSDEWRALLHYHGEPGQWLSHADDDRFFFAEDGATNPEAEIKATLEAFQQVSIEDNTDHPQCLFPARLHWLKNKLPGLANSLPSITCEKFDKWVSDMQPAGITMVFPAAYINSPSSMFGHTFLRIDHKDQTEKTRLLAYSISYAAEVPEEGGGLAFAWKGLFGGYPGLLAGAAYYDKVIEYNDLEARDIWEYELDLSQEEIDQLIRHTWELQHMLFHYYFFDENCSFRLLSLLDVARPGLNTTRAFSTHAIPADTVRVVEDTGIVKGKVFRPSALTELRYRSRQMSRQQRKLALALSEGEIEAKELAEQLGEPEQAQVLDFTHDYLRYRAQRDFFRRKEFGSRSLRLLSARSRLPEQDIEAVPEPVSPEDGHNTARVDLAYGELEQRPFLSMRLRPAFHDLLDNDQGYISGAQIDFLSLDSRYYYEEDRLQLERFSLLDISALSPRNAFFKPLSWRIETGWKRYHEHARNNLRFTLEGGGGVTQELNENLSVSVLGAISLRSRPLFQGDFDLGVGVEGRVIWRLPGASKLLLSAASWEFDGKNASDGERYGLGLNIPVINRDHAIRLELSRDKLRDVSLDTVRLGWNYYF